MLHYNIGMTDHPHPHHHHHPGRGHPPATLHASILRLSAFGRLAASAVVVAVLWTAVVWAMQ
jgi:hypothetical protein